MDVYVFHQIYRINYLCEGKSANFFASKNEIILKLKHLATSDVEKVFRKVKEALEVSACV